MSVGCPIQETQELKKMFEIVLCYDNLSRCFVTLISILLMSVVWCGLLGKAYIFCNCHRDRFIAVKNQTTSSIRGSLTLTVSRPIHSTR